LTKLRITGRFRGVVRADASTSARTPEPALSDLPTEIFLVLRKAFFNIHGLSRPFELREKRNTQDDPFDEHVHRLLANRLPAGCRCVKAPGPLITPDLVALRPAACNGVARTVLAADLNRVVAMEVKKLERTSAGGVARASGMDYNTTPPCGKVRVYDVEGEPLDIRGFYLFVCQEPAPKRAGRYRLSAMTLCDGNLLNADFDFYLSIVGARTKRIRLGTFADGVNRDRPMLIFSNPLGIGELDHHVTLIHPRHDIERDFTQLSRVGSIQRTARDQSVHTFSCYRLRDEPGVAETPFKLSDPFPTPERTEATQPRGRFRVDIRPAH
jgi:hypothetical protein